jgi:signal transduction histidine kinase
MSQPITFSRRLYGLQANAIFLIFSLGVMPSAITNSAGSPLLPALVSLMVLFTALATLGWRYCLRRMSPRLLYGYFISVVALFGLIFLVENLASGHGASSGNLSVIPVLQASVLAWRWRWGIFAAVIALMAGISALGLSLLGVLTGTFVATLFTGSVLLFGHLIVSEEQARAELAATNRKLAEYAAQVEELATARERNRLAREIHDNLGHYLTAVNMQLEAAKAVLPLDPAKTVGAIEKAQVLTKEGLSEVRRSVAALRADATETSPLPEALAALAENLRADGLDVQVVLEGEARPCPAGVELALYRIAQEALTNVQKHAQAAHARLALCYADNRVRLTLHDDGKGASSLDGGFGIIGIKERARQLGGLAEIRTAPSEGFTLHVEIPA